MSEFTRIIIRHDTSDNWMSVNPILAEGEYGHDMTVNRLKVGDGVTPWNELDWSTASYSDIANTNSELVQHENNSTIHVTQSEKDSWNSKSDFSGSYEDLTDKPSIPTSTSDLTNDSGYITSNNIGNGTVTINQGGELKGSFTMNQSGDTVINLGQGIASVGWDDITGKPNFSEVATSGDYDDLSNKPEIPTVNDAQITFKQGENTVGTITLNQSGNSVLTFSEGGGGEVGWNDITDKPNFATVATSGSYSDLTNTPTIPTVNDATLTINQGGVLKGTFTANASSNVTIDLGEGLSSVDWDDITDKPTFATVATSGSYNDLDDKPTIPSAPVQSNWNESDSSSLAYIQNKPTIPAAQVNSDWNAASGVAQILNKPALSAVATSGQYSDLSGTPNLTTVATTGSYADLSNKPAIPTSTSDLTNNSNFVSDANYVHTDNNFTDAEKTKLSGIETGAEANVQANWNETNSSSDAYIQNKPTIPTSVTDLSDASDYVTYDELADSGQFSDTLTLEHEYGGEIVGTAQTEIDNEGNFSFNYSDGTNSFQTEIVEGVMLVNGDVDFSAATVSGLSYDDLEDAPTDLGDFTNNAGYVTSSELATVATSGSYNDLSNTPTIPTAVSDLTNDAGYLVSGNLKTLNSESLVGSGDIAIKPFRQSTITNVSATSLAVNENTVYTFGTNPTQLSLTIPNSQYESDIYFTAGGNFTLGLPVGTVVYGSASIVSGKHYAIAIKDGKVVIAHDGETTPTVSWNDITGKPTFATVATSGDYNDLSNTPTIPTVNNATLTIRQGGVAKGTFTANASQNVTIDLGESLTSVDWDDITDKPTFATVATSGDYNDLSSTPTSLSDFTNDTGYLTVSDLATVATTGEYQDLVNPPTNLSDFNNDTDFAVASDLATVATTGDYDDLENKPTIPTVNNATLTIRQGGVTKGTFTANASQNVTISLDGGGGGGGTSSFTNQTVQYEEIEEEEEGEPTGNILCAMFSIEPANRNAYVLDDYDSDYENVLEIDFSSLNYDVTTDEMYIRVPSSNDTTTAPLGEYIFVNLRNLSGRMPVYGMEYEVVTDENDNTYYSLSLDYLDSFGYMLHFVPNQGLIVHREGGGDMEEYEITFTLEDESTLTKVFWVKPDF